MKLPVFVVLPHELRLAPMALALLLSGACRQTAAPDPSLDDALGPWPDEVAALMPDGVSLSGQATCVSIARLAERDPSIEQDYDAAFGLVQYDAEGRPLVRYRNQVELFLAPQEPFDVGATHVIGDLDTLTWWRDDLGVGTARATEVLDLFSYAEGREIGRRLFRGDDGAFALSSTTTLLADPGGRMLEADVQYAGASHVTAWRWPRDARGLPTEATYDGNVTATWTWDGPEGQSTFEDGFSTCAQRWEGGRLQEQTCDLGGWAGAQRTYVLTYAEDGALHRAEFYDPNASPRRTRSTLYSPSAAAWDVMEIPEAQGDVYYERERDAEGRVVRTEVGWRAPAGAQGDQPRLWFEHEWFCR